MILNSYFNTLHKVVKDTSRDDVNIITYTIPAIWKEENNPDNKANMIYPTDFKTWDVLIYTNENDVKYSLSTTTGLVNGINVKGTEVTPITYENWEYAYIYLDGKFVGINLGNDGQAGTIDDRNEFGIQYYTDNNLPLYSTSDITLPVTDELKENFHYQTLFGKDAYVVLRPSLMIRDITYELDGWTNNEDNSSAFIIGGEFELKKPTKTGFTFYGWYTDPEYTNQVYNTNEFTDDVVLYAKWDLTTFEKAFQEVAYAYYMRWPYMHYNSAKWFSDILPPEESTSQDYHYMTCTPYIMNVYKELLGIVLTPADAHYVYYAKDYVGKRPEVIWYGEKSGKILYWWDGTTTYESWHNMENPTQSYIISQLKIGDILHYDGHVMLVYDYVYDSSGNIDDVYLLHSWQANYITYTKTDHTTREYYYTTGLNASGDVIYQSHNLKRGLSPWSKLWYNYRDRRWVHEDSRIEGTVILQTLKEKADLDGTLSFSWNYKNNYVILRFVDDTKGEWSGLLNFDGQWTWWDNPNDTLNKFIYSTFLGLGIQHTENNTPINYSDSVKSRLKYSKLYIEKTVDKKDNNIVEPWDELTYKIIIKNESKWNYENNLIVKENINTDLVENLSLYSYTKNWIQANEIQLLNNGNLLQWNIWKLNSGDEVIIEYKVKVKTWHIGDIIESTGLVDNIPSWIIKNKIWRNLKGQDSSLIAEKYEVLKEKNYTGKRLINKIYEEVYGIDLWLDDFNITWSVGKTGETGLILYNWKWNAYWNTWLHATMYINSGNMFSWMVLNNYFNTLRKSVSGDKISQNGVNIILYEIPALWLYENPDNRANTIYPTDFKTWDILIYTNTNDIKYSLSGYDTVEKYITYEDGEYAYIYIDWRFVGVNLGNDGVKDQKTGGDDRNIFITREYYDVNDLYSYTRVKMDGDYLEKTGVICREPTTWSHCIKKLTGEMEEFLRYQSLFGKDAYVILRPSLMIRDITYELNGWTNNDDNPTAYILGRQVELKNPTRDGFVFQGWYTDSEYTNINQVNNTSDFTDDVVLYAKWESNKCEFNGTPVNHWESVTGYKTSTVPYWVECESEIRTCTNWELSWTFEYWSCTVWQPASCEFNGTPVNHWESVTGYKTSTVPYWVECESEIRTCINWELSWSYGYSSCTVWQPASCTFNGILVNHWESVTGYKTSTVPYWVECESELRTCINWTLSWSYGYSSCTVWQPASCTFNGNSVDHWESVTWYESSIVEYWETCKSEIRTCTNWHLSGSYRYWRCTVWQPASCTFNGNSVDHWESVTWYESSTVEYWETCKSEIRTCINWTLGWSYEYSSCTVWQPASCIFSGNLVNHWESVTGYRADSVPYWEMCESETRTCINWYLSWSFQYWSCTVQSSRWGWWTKLRKDDCPDWDYSDSYYDWTCGTKPVQKDNGKNTNRENNKHNSAGELRYDTSKFDSQYSDEMNQAYQYAYHYGITTKENIKNADMGWKLTRIAMAKMLSQYAINVLWKQPDITKHSNFIDVSDSLDAKYNNWVTLAYQLWIMWINMPNNEFKPYNYVSRAQFVTALSRLLYWIQDGDDKYYSTHMNLLKYKWIITNTDPTMKELRWYVMLMLMRSANN